jgi:GLPGLI family protein
MKKIYIVFILSCSINVLQSQNFQGKAYYESKTNATLNMEGREISEEQKKMIQERMKQALEKTYVLTFNQSEATYKEEEKLQQPGTTGGGGGAFVMMGGFSSGGYYKDIKRGIYYDQREMFGKNFLIKDTLSKLQWKLENETKQIGNYTCFKATAIKPVDQLDFRSMRRKNNNEEKKDEAVKDSVKTSSLFGEVDIPKEIAVTAWYTPEIPISQGPGEYWGLPGLILEVSADRTTILCSKIVMNPKEKEVIEAPSKGKEITQKEYNDIMIKKMEEMREMYDGGRNGRNGGMQLRIGG